jgi:hypothetical protein
MGCHLLPAGHCDSLPQCSRRHPFVFSPASHGTPAATSRPVFLQRPVLWRQESARIPYELSYGTRAFFAPSAFSPPSSLSLNRRGPVYRRGCVDDARPYYSGGTRQEVDRRRVVVLLGHGRKQEIHAVMRCLSTTHLF